MKKILSSLLLLTMLVMGALLLTSCDEMTEKKMEKDPVTALDDAEKNTIDAFFGDEAGASAVLDKAADKGSLNLTFTSLAADAEGLSKISETIFWDSKTSAAVSDTLVSIAGQDLSARIFLDKNGMVFGSESILGNTDSLAINIDTVIAKLKGSYIADQLEMEDEVVTELIGLMESLKESLNATAEENKAEMKEWSEKIYAILNQTITTEKVEKDKFIVVTYTLDNDSIHRLIDLLLSEIKADGSIPAEDMAELETTIDQSIDPMLEQYVIDLTYKQYIAGKNNTIAKETVSATVIDHASFAEGTGQPNTYKADVTCTYSDKQIAVSLDGEIAGKAITGTFTIDKTKEGDKTTYAFKLSGGYANVDVDILKGTYTYDKATGDIIIDADLIKDESDTVKLSAKANYTVSADAVTFKLLSVGFGENRFGTDTHWSELSLTIRAVDAIPQKPADAKDIMNLTGNEWEKVISDIQQSPIGQMLGAIPGFGGPPDHYKKFYRSGMTIYLPKGFEYVSGTGYTAAYSNDIVTILALEDDFDQTEGLEDYTLEEYGKLILRNSDMSISKLKEEGGVTYFTYTSREYTFLAALYKGEDSFWMIQFAVEDDLFDNYERDFMNWAAYVEVE